MTGARILVVEDDLEIQQVLRRALLSAGYEVITASDGNQALQAARQSIPDLVLLDVMLPVLDGWAVAKQLRAMPEFALLPITFTTALPANESLIDSFRLGGVDYINKPVRFDDLLTRVRNALKRREVVEAVLRARTQQAPGFRGTLDQVGLASLLTIMEMERRTGVLTLVRGSVSAQIHLRQGKAVQARVSNNAALTNANAVYHLLAWDQGQAEFNPQSVDVPDEINLPIMHLLMEGARLLDEARRSGQMP
ncbi:MAG: response regulator [Myxococcota bacterium]